jgi:hypothetical protein
LVDQYFGRMAYKYATGSEGVDVIWTGMGSDPDAWAVAWKITGVSGAPSVTNSQTEQPPYTGQSLRGETGCDTDAMTPTAARAAVLLVAFSRDVPWTGSGANAFVNHDYHPVGALVEDFDRGQNTPGNAASHQPAWTFAGHQLITSTSGPYSASVTTTGYVDDPNFGHVEPISAAWAGIACIFVAPAEGACS